MVAEKIDRKYAVGLSSGTAALHIAVKLCDEKLYGKPMHTQAMDCAEYLVRKRRKG